MLIIRKQDSVSSDTHFSNISNRDDSTVQIQSDTDSQKCETPPIGLEYSQNRQIADEMELPRVEGSTSKSDKLLFGMLFTLCFFSNGFMPSISTFVSMPFGLQGNAIINVAQSFFP